MKNKKEEKKPCKFGGFCYGNKKVCIKCGENLNKKDEK
jgi:hypothetical protein